MWDGTIDLRQDVITIPSPSGEQKIASGICNGWRDCGLLELGILKPLV